MKRNKDKELDDFVSENKDRFPVPISKKSPIKVTVEKTEKKDKRVADYVSKDKGSSLVPVTKRPSEFIKPGIKGKQFELENYFTQQKGVDIIKIAHQLFDLRKEEELIITFFINNISERLRLNGKIKEANKWVTLTGQIITLLQNVTQIQTLYSGLQRMGLEDEIKELELETEKQRVLVGLEIIPQIERTKKRLELENLELQITQIQAEKEKVRKGEKEPSISQKSPVEEARGVIETQSMIEQFIIEKQEKREERLREYYDDLLTNKGYTPEEATRIVDEIRQQLTQTGLRSL